MEVEKESYLGNLAQYAQHSFQNQSGSNVTFFNGFKFVHNSNIFLCIKFESKMLSNRARANVQEQEKKILEDNQDSTADDMNARLAVAAAEREREQREQREAREREQRQKEAEFQRQREQEQRERENREREARERRAKEVEEARKARELAVKGASKDVRVKDAGPGISAHAFQNFGVDERSMSTICSFLTAGDLVQLCSTRKNALRGVSVDLMERTVVTKPFHHDRGAYETGPSCSSKAFTVPARTRRSDGVTLFHLSIISAWGGASVRKLSLEIHPFDVVAEDLPEEVRLLAQQRNNRLMSPLAELGHARVGTYVEELHLYGRGGWLTWLAGIQFCTNLKQLTFHDVPLNPEAWRRSPRCTTEEMSYNILLRHFLHPITACPLQCLAFYTSEQLVQSNEFSNVTKAPYDQITTLEGIGYHSLGGEDSRIMETLETLIVQRMPIVEIPAGYVFVLFRM